MQKALIKIIVKLMREYADKIEAGTCELTEEEQSDILSALTHKALCKEEACEFLNIKRSRFDDLVRLGKIPRGRKRKRDNKLVWYKDELYTIILNN